MYMEKKRKEREVEEKEQQADTFKTWKIQYWYLIQCFYKPIQPWSQSLEEERRRWWWRQRSLQEEEEGEDEEKEGNVERIIDKEVEVNEREKKDGKGGREGK